MRTTDSRHDLPAAPNLLNRNFTAAAPNQIWLADITYVETDEGRLCLSTVMDPARRKVVGWAMRDHLHTELPLAALRMAKRLWRSPVRVSRDREHGFQYSSGVGRLVELQVSVEDLTLRLALRSVDAGRGSGRG